MDKIKEKIEDIIQDISDLRKDLFEKNAELIKQKGLIDFIEMNMIQDISNETTKINDKFKRKYSNKELREAELINRKRDNEKFKEAINKKQMIKTDIEMTKIDLEVARKTYELNIILLKL